MLFTTKSESVYAIGYDGNGNIQTLTNLADGLTSADLEYDPFGNMLKAAGTAANVCALGFSTKYTDADTGIVYFGFRYYNPSSGRWLSRDPLEEEGGVGLYNLLGDNGVNRIDPLGLRHLPLIWDTLELRKISAVDAVKIGLVFKDLYSNLKDLGPQEAVDVFNAVSEIKSSVDTLINANHVDKWPLVSTSTTKYEGDVKCFENIGFVISAKGFETEMDVATGKEGGKVGRGKVYSPYPSFIMSTVRKRVYFIYRCKNSKAYTKAELERMVPSQLDDIARRQAEPDSIQRFDE